MASKKSIYDNDSIPLTSNTTSFQKYLIKKTVHTVESQSKLILTRKIFIFI